MSAYNIALNESTLKIGFGSPAQNDQIVKDAEARLDEMVAAGELVEDTASTQALIKPQWFAARGFLLCKLSEAMAAREFLPPTPFLSRAARAVRDSAKRRRHFAQNGFAHFQR